MKKITASNGTFGPFERIQVMSDHYLADGAIYPFGVIGDGYAISDYVPTPAAPVVPQSISMKQARMALYSAGKLTQVNDAVTALTGTEGDLARIQWEYSASVDRNNELVVFITSLLGWTESETDNLFIGAAQII